MRGATSLLCLLIASSAAAAPVRRAPLHRPEQVVQIKLRDLLDLVPRKGSPDQAQLLARLKAIEDRMTALEERIKELEQQLRTPTPLPPEPPKTLGEPAKGKR